MNTPNISSDIMVAEIVINCTNAMQNMFWMSILACSVTIAFGIIVLFTIHGYLSENAKPCECIVPDNPPVDKCTEEEEDDEYIPSGSDSNIDEEEEEDYDEEESSHLDIDDEEEEEDIATPVIITENGDIIIPIDEFTSSTITADGTVIVNNDDHADDPLHGATIITSDGKVIANISESDDDIDVNNVPSSDNEPIIVNNAGINDELVNEVINHVMSLDK